MTAGKEAELPICRIAQLARAVVFMPSSLPSARQQISSPVPSKPTFPARVAFRGCHDGLPHHPRPFGAQQLIGKKGICFTYRNDPVRVQCAFVDTPEVERIAKLYQQTTRISHSLHASRICGWRKFESSIGEVDMNRLDPMFEDAARLVVIHQQGFYLTDSA